jgi:ParB family chromosome partitioning protein
MGNRHGLGRGLSALLTPTVSAPLTGSSAILEIPVAAISPNPLQPRKRFGDEALAELSASMKRSGVLQPVVVRRSGSGYQLIVGERRWRAARMAGLERIPALVRETADAEGLELALVENLLREDLNPIEEAEAYQRLLAEFGWTQEELAAKVGKDRSSVANGLRLLRLPAPIQDDLRAGRLAMGHARALLSLASEAEQLRLRDEILAHSWSVRTTEEGVQTRRVTVSRRVPRRSPDITALEDRLREALATRVRVVGNERRGRIEIVYTSSDELDRLTETLTGGR